MLIKEMPAARSPPPTGRPKGGNPLSNTRILRNALTDEVKRTILRESETRYRHELMDEEERMLLWDRILRLRRQLRLA